MLLNFPIVKNAFKIIRKH